ncbi:MAG: right-handed parallel beta-helix repeat-containing protein [Deltaproteobacteria bacterium]|nr:right-handed parallel beta-helix repeat-containing protein [Deltaproteobacteria bacterium]
MREGCSGTRWTAWTLIGLVAACSPEDGGPDGDATHDGEEDDGGADGDATHDGEDVLGDETAPEAGDVPEDAGPPPAVYVHPEGDDADPGTFERPVRTFDRALALWRPGLEIRAFGGVFEQRLDVALAGTADRPLRVLPVAGEAPVIDTRTVPGGQSVRLEGAFVEVEGFEVRSSENQCVVASGSDLVLRGLHVHDCVSHGVLIEGTRVRAEGLVIHDTVLENEGGSGGGWGSALKVQVGGDGVELVRNRVFHNWGEGIAVTRGSNVAVRENRVYDNFSVNIYIDNSYEVTVEGNFTFCTEGSGYEREGRRATAISLGEEFYDGWGAQLHDVVVRNNIAWSCDRGFGYWGSDVGGDFRDVAIVHNTFWGSVTTALSIEHGALPAHGIAIAGNLVGQPDDRLAWIDDAAGFELSGNFWAGTPPATASGPGDRSGDPGFAAEPAATAASFRLGESSAARDGAEARTDAPVDFEGTARSTVESPAADMGAMEYKDPSLPCAFDALWE